MKQSSVWAMDKLCERSVVQQHIPETPQRLGLPIAERACLNHRFQRNGHCESMSQSHDIFPLPCNRKIPNRSWVQQSRSAICENVTSEFWSTCSIIQVICSAWRPISGWAPMVSNIKDSGKPFTFSCTKPSTSASRMSLHLTHASSVQW